MREFLFCFFFFFKTKTTHDEAKTTTAVRLGNALCFGGCPWLPHRAVKPLGSSQSKKRRVQAICLRTLTEQ